MHAKETPPNSPAQSASEPAVLLEVTQDFVDRLQLFVASKAVVEGSSKVEITQIPASEDSSSEEARPRASKLEYKSINEVWDKKAASYTIAEPVASTSVDELDQYIFVHRRRIERATLAPTSYVDIKSKELQEVLMKDLADVRGVSLREDKPSIEANLLYSFLPELRRYQKGIKKDTTMASHLAVLLDFVDSTYETIDGRLQSLLQNKEITFDLLWALFKPNSDIYTTCLGTEEMMCVRCNHGEEKVRMNGARYFSLEARNFDNDGKTFGEGTITIEIEKFRGTKRIDLLEAFPLRYHPDAANVRKSLVGNGRIFVSLVGTQHYRKYQGKAFWKDEKGEIKAEHVNSRIIVDAHFSRQSNPNYAKSNVDMISGILYWSTDDSAKKIKDAELSPWELHDHQLLICSPTVSGFSLQNKRWLEFAVANIRDIDWNPTSFDHLTIPARHKKVIEALSQAHLTQDSDEHFDDFVLGKGRGLVILLHGSPGIGKTFTAEAISEHLRRPLYSISAGELGTTAELLEKRLTDIFNRASHWKAVLLLDEADIFVEQRATQDVHRNALVCVFLRMLEYYEGILFLTTNRVKTMDEAVASRIHLSIRYDGLNQIGRTTVWKDFLKRASTKKGAAALSSKDLDRLSEKNLNGRQIKNVVATARALAAHESNRIRWSHLEEAIDFNENFECDFRGAGHLDTMHSYT